MNNRVVNVKQSYIDELKKYSWPGNIRELKNVVERDYYISEEELISIDALDYSNNNEEIINMKPLKEDFKIVPLSELEENAIKNAIKKCDGNIQLAAKLLNIGRATLYRKLKIYGLDVSK
jgi:Response regulator containing CheY-like receiver, AAA-type ATPase, and DNA-binding domains